MTSFTAETPRSLVVGQQIRVGRIVSESFGLLVANGKLFLLLMLLTHGPLLAHDLVRGTDHALETAIADDWTSTAVGFASLLFYAVLVGAATAVAFNRLRSQPVTLVDSFRLGWARSLVVLVVTMLAAIAVAIGLFALLVPGLFLLTILFVAAPVAVLERPGVFASLSRSEELTKGNRWRVLALAIGFVAATILPDVAIFLIGEATTLPAAAWATLGWTLYAVVLVFGAVLITTTYHALRVVIDGYDTSAVADVFD